METEPKVVRGFLAARWAGLVPLPTLFWRDMLVVGSLVNLASGALALVLFLNEAPTWLAALMFLSPLPYNVFLVLAVWRRTEREGGGWTPIYRLVSLVWLVVATLA